MTSVDAGCAGFLSLLTPSSALRPGMASRRCWFSSTAAGILFLALGNSESRAGVHNSFWVQSPAGKSSPRPERSTRSKATLPASRVTFARIRASSAGMSGTNPTMKAPGIRPASSGMPNAKSCSPARQGFRLGALRPPHSARHLGIWRFDAGESFASTPSRASSGGFRHFVLSRLPSRRSHRCGGRANAELQSPALVYGVPCPYRGQYTCGYPALFHRHKIAAFNWGGVTERRRLSSPGILGDTVLTEPDVWFHDLLRPTAHHFATARRLCSALSPARPSRPHDIVNEFRMRRRIPSATHWRFYKRKTLRWRWIFSAGRMPIRCDSPSLAIPIPP